MMDLSLCRSLLFTPGLRPERFGNAKTAGADAVLVDLEDAVALPSKAEARSRALPYFAGVPDDGVARCLRVNSLRTADGLLDGRMVDRPVVRAAHRILAIAARPTRT